MRQRSVVIALLFGVDDDRLGWAKSLVTAGGWQVWGSFFAVIHDPPPSR